MKLTEIIILLVAMFVFTGSANAGDWKGEFSVANISVEGTEAEPIVYLNLVATTVNAWPEPYCAAPGYVTLATSSRRGEQAFSVAMLAASSSKKIWVRFEPGCNSDRYIISGINLVN